MVTFEAMRWLTMHNVPVFMLDYNGSMISAILPPQPLRADLRRAQLEAYSDIEKRVRIARVLIEAKLERSSQVLDWMHETHDIETELRSFKKEAYRLASAQTVDDVRGCEGRAAEIYWQAFQQTVPLRLEFKARSTRARNRQNNANDPVNALLNYGYVFLQSYVRRAINMTGLDPSLGFLHEDKQSTTPLVYDFQEPFRWLVDITVLRLIESRTFSQDDFYFTAEDYRLRIKPPLLDRYANLLREQFNSGALYRGDRLQWDTLILRKCQELARFLVGKTDRFEVVTPQPALVREDTKAVRDRICSLTSGEAKKLGIGKSTLHYLRNNARGTSSFRVYKKVRRRLRFSETELAMDQTA
jgi:CRISPR-associated protein Cas1